MLGISKTTIAILSMLIRNTVSCLIYRPFPSSFFPLLSSLRSGLSALSSIICVLGYFSLSLPRPYFDRLSSPPIRKGMGEEERKGEERRRARARGAHSSAQKPFPVVYISHIDCFFFPYPYIFDARLAAAAHLYPIV